MLAVAAACLTLIPGQPLWLLGLEVLAGVALVWLLEAFAVRAILREEDRHGACRSGKVLMGALPSAVFNVGAVLLVAGADTGYVWVAAGSILAIIGAVLFSWSPSWRSCADPGAGGHARTETSPPRPTWGLPGPVQDSPQE